VLHFFPDKNQFYQQSLENIAAIEFFALLNFKAAEMTYNRLISEFPNNAKYQEELTQLYHFSEQYTAGKQQMVAIQEAWYSRKFSNDTYRAGMVQIDGFADEILRAEVFWNPSKDPANKPIYTAFVFSVNATRSLGKIEVFEMADLWQISGYGFETPLELEKSADYQKIKELIFSELNINKQNLKP
jgi:hypothetical protein